MSKILDNKKIWPKFVEFFREIKGHSDWTEEQIDYSRTEDDEVEFVLWLCGEERWWK